MLLLVKLQAKAYIHKSSYSDKEFPMIHISSVNISRNPWNWIYHVCCWRLLHWLLNGIIITGKMVKLIVIICDIFIWISNCNFLKGMRLRKYLAGIYMFKFNNRNTRTACEICSKLAIKATEWRRSVFYIFHFEHISHLVQVFLMWALSR